MPSVATGFPMVLGNQGVFQRAATWGIAAALLVAGTVFWSPRLDTRLARTFIVLGTASYSTYLVSPWCLEFIERGATWLSGPPSATAHVLAHRFAILIGTLLLGWLIYNFIEWPLLRKLQARLLTRPPKALS